MRLYTSRRTVLGGTDMVVSSWPLASTITTCPPSQPTTTLDPSQCQARQVPLGRTEASHSHLPGTHGMMWPQGVRGCGNCVSWRTISSCHAEHTVCV